MNSHQLIVVLLLVVTTGLALLHVSHFPVEGASASPAVIQEAEPSPGQQHRAAPAWAQERRRA